jgi:hypothetical protein
VRVGENGERQQRGKTHERGNQATHSNLPLLRRTGTFF